MRRLLPVLAGLLLICGPAATASAPAPVVTGYALDDLPDRVLDREAPALATLGVDGVTLTADGAEVGDPSAGALHLAARARDHGLRPELLVSNYSADLGDFSPAVGHALLGSSAHRDHVAARLASFVGPSGFAGITVDLESLAADDADGLTAFVTALRDALPAGSTISVDLMASTTTAGYADLGYDVSALAARADVLALMAYDQHGPGWSGPGPIGALTWQRRTLDALTAVVPAGRVDLGVAGYGYTWKRNGGGGAVSVRRARAIARAWHVAPVWHGEAGEWSAALPDGTRLWWSDRRSWDLRTRVARNRGLHGLALWRLGSADSLR